MLGRGNTLRWLPPLLAATFALACSQESDPQRSDVAARSPVVDQPAARRGPTRRVATVDWAAARSFRRLDAAAMPSPLRLTLASAPVPALVPTTPALLAAGKPTKGPSWYAVSMRLHDHTVFVTGNREEVVLPGISDGAVRRPDFEPQVSRSRGIVTASFYAFGVAYALSVECARPLDDARCAQNGYVRSLFAALALAGGAS